MARHDAKQTTTAKAPKKATRSNKQIQQTLLTTASPITQQPPQINLSGSRKQKKPHLTPNFHRMTLLLTLQYNYSTRTRQLKL